MACDKFDKFTLLSLLFIKRLNKDNFTLCSAVLNYITLKKEVVEVKANWFYCYRNSFNRFLGAIYLLFGIQSTIVSLNKKKTTYQMMPFDLVLIWTIKIAHSYIVEKSGNHFWLFDQLNLLSCLFVSIFFAFNLTNRFLQSSFREEHNALFIYLNWLIVRCRFHGLKIIIL